MVWCMSTYPSADHRLLAPACGSNAPIIVLHIKSNAPIISSFGTNHWFRSALLVLLLHQLLHLLLPHAPVGDAEPARVSFAVNAQRALLDLDLAFVLPIAHCLQNSLGGLRTAFGGWLVANLAYTD